MEGFDLIVIGAGPGGYVCAIRAAQLGLRVACIEASETLGGTCLNVGCVPSKALLESSHHFHMAENQLKNHGILCDSIKLDLKHMQARKEKIVADTVTGIDFLFRKNKITHIKGFGKILGTGKVQIIDKKKQKTILESKHIVIATGSKPIEIPAAPFDHKHILDSTDALALTKVPEHLVIIGAGVIGLEIGSIWMRLGSKVTVIEATNKILGATDNSLSRELLKILRKEGADLRLKTQLKKTIVENNKVLLNCTDEKDEPIEIKANKVLVAVGRRPYINDLGVRELNIDISHNGAILVNDQYQTSVPGIYAIGDVIPGPMLAHKAEEEGVAVAEIIAGQHGEVNYDAIASIVYTWPEIASVGKTEEECKHSGIEYKTGKFFFKANARAKAMDATEGFVKILSEKRTDRILGIHIIGPMASEMIAEASLAIEYGASAEDIARTVHAHPTLSEVMKEAALAVDGFAIHQ